MTTIQELLLNNIKDARKRLEISQMKLAEMCGVSTSYIGEIEIGRKFPSDATLQKIADALGLRPYQLLLGDQDLPEDRSKVLGQLYDDLKARLDADMLEVFNEHMS